METKVSASGDSALSLAFQKKWYEGGPILVRSLAARVDLPLPPNSGTVLSRCVALGDAEGIRRLVDLGADARKALPASSATDLVASAALQGNAEVMKVLLSTLGLWDHLRPKGGNGQAPLYLAASHGHGESVRAIISAVREASAHPDPNHPGPSNPSAPEASSSRSAGEAVSSKTPDLLPLVNMRDAATGLTALGVASMKGHESAVRALLEVNGIDLACVGEVLDLDLDLGLELN